MDPLKDCRSLDVHHRLPGYLAVSGGDDDLEFAAVFGEDLGILVDIAIGMAADDNGFFPAADCRADVVHHDRLAENGTVEHGPDGAVG